MYTLAGAASNGNHHSTQTLPKQPTTFFPATLSQRLMTTLQAGVCSMQLFVRPDNYTQARRTGFSSTLVTELRQCLLTDGLKRSAQEHQTIENLFAAPSSRGIFEACMSVTELRTFDGCLLINHCL